jgi:hypothetical protein
MKFQKPLGGETKRDQKLYFCGGMSTIVHTQEMQPLHNFYLISFNKIAEVGEEIADSTFKLKG